MVQAHCHRSGAKHIDPPPFFFLPGSRRTRGENLLRSAAARKTKAHLDPYRPGQDAYRRFGGGDEAESPPHRFFVDLLLHLEERAGAYETEVSYKRPPSPPPIILKTPFWMLDTRERLKRVL